MFPTGRVASCAGLFDFKTCDDHDEVMKDSLGIADFKAHLSEVLRQVRRGRSFTLLDRKTPVARLAPIAERPEPLPVRHALRPLSAVVLPKPVRPGDSLADLVADRQRR